MRQLANELGCSPMTPYRYFKDKNEILATVRATAFNRLCDGLERASQEAEACSPAVAAQRVCRAYIDFARREPHAYRLMFDLTQPDEDAYPALAAATARARAAIAKDLAGPPPRVASGKAAMVQGYLHWAMLHGAVMLHLSGKLGGSVGPDDLIGAVHASLAHLSTPDEAEISVRH